MLHIGIWIGVSVVLTCYYWLVVAQRPKVYSNNPRINAFIDKHLPITRQRFYPSPLCSSGVLQTVLGDYQRGLLTNAKSKVDIFRLSDGGQLALKILDQSSKQKGRKTIVLLLPGAGGDSEAGYMRTLAKSIQRGGAKTIVFNNRGMGGIRLTTPKTHTCKNPEDLREVLHYIKNNYPDHSIIVSGVSLGAVIISHYLLDYPEEAARTLTAAYFISTVWNHYNAMLTLETSYFHWLINRHLANNFFTRLFHEREILEKRFDFQILDNCGQSVRDFEVHVNLPQTGFSTLHEYWTEAIIKGKTHKFPIPVFSLNAEDDPMIHREDLPTEEIIGGDHSNLALFVTKRGGHIGFLEGVSFWPRDTHYMERFTTELVTALRLYSDEL